MTKIGLISDIHFSYSHGNKLTPQGVNQREQDVYSAGFIGVANLLNAGVDAIVDLGDMAHVPMPRKRAIISLMRLLNIASEVPYYSANGNHTLQRSSTDMHLYQLLAELVPNFRGKTEPFLTDFGAYLIPYGDSEYIKRAIDAMPHDAVFIGGHWAAEDVPFPGSHVPLSNLPKDKPVFLGHYHTRAYAGNDIGRHVAIENLWPYPFYIGATERYAWGEWQNPTGVAIFDTDSKTLEFIDHKTRDWQDIHVNSDDYLEDVHYANIEGKIVRVTVNATAAQYNSLDLVALKKKLTGSLENQVRRSNHRTLEPPSTTGTHSFSIITGWTEHISSAKIGRGVNRKKVEGIGLAAIADAGGV